MRNCLKALVVSSVIVSGCSLAEREPQIRTVFVAPQIPDAAKKPCPAPVALPDRDLGERDITSLWGTDRNNLKACELKRSLAAGSIAAATESGMSKP